MRPKSFQILVQRVEGLPVQRMRVDFVYMVGEDIGALKNLASDPLPAITLHEAKTTLSYFLTAWGGHLGVAKGPAEKLLSRIEAAIKDVPRVGSQAEASAIFAGVVSRVENFESLFFAEGPNIDAYLVEEVGILSVRKLLNDASQDFAAAGVLDALPAIAVDDYKAAGRCLAFGLHTACGFHLMRSLESLIVAYYVRIIGKAPRQRNWGRYIADLEKKAPEHLLGQLKHLKNSERNPLIHPETTLSQAEAVRVFHKVTGTMMDFARALSGAQAPPGPPAC